MKGRESRESEEIKYLVNSLDEMTRRREIPEVIRRKVICYTDRRRKEGARFSVISRELDLSSWRIREWYRNACKELEQRDDKSPDEPCFSEVTVRQEGNIAKDSDELSIITPNGYRICGFDLQSIYYFLRMTGDI
jgi:hypothetical protein